MWPFLISHYVTFCLPLGDTFFSSPILWPFVSHVVTFCLPCSDMLFINTCLPLGDPFVSSPILWPFVSHIVTFCLPCSDMLFINTCLPLGDPFVSSPMLTIVWPFVSLCRVWVHDGGGGGSGGASVRGDEHAEQSGALHVDHQGAPRPPHPLLRTPTLLQHPQGTIHRWVLYILLLLLLVLLFFLLLLYYFYYNFFGHGDSWSDTRLL